MPNGGQLIADVLDKQGVKHVFTLCGGHISPILSASKAKGIRVVDVRNEATAAFAADAMARLSGIPGVCAVTAGPGLTNTLTALQNARMAESPVVVLGGAAATLLKGRGSLQDIDQLGLLKPLAKKVSTAKAVRDLVPKTEAAFHEAAEGIPGPVLVECPIDLLYDEAIIREWYDKETGKSKDLAGKALQLYVKQHLWRQFAGTEGLTANVAVVPDVPEPSVKDVEKVVAMIEKAERPVFVIGSQTVLLAKEVQSIANAIRAIGAPVYLAGMARGLLGISDIQFRHARGKALKQADLVVICGFPMDFRLSYGSGIPKKATLVTVNRDKAVTKKNRTPTLGVVGDAGRFLQAVASRLARKPVSKWADWFTTLKQNESARDAEIIAESKEPVGGFVNPIALALEIEKQLDEDSVLVVDGGDFVATASYVVGPRRPLSWLDPGVFGTLGVGAGFALAAGLARPEAEIWLFWGDGAAGYGLAELDTFVRHKVPVICVVGNNGSWAQIARDQIEILKDDVATKLVRNDYHIVAEGFGAKGLLLDKPENIGKVIAKAKALAKQGHAVLINALIQDTDFRKGSISM